MKKHRLVCLAVVPLFLCGCSETPADSRTDSQSPAPSALSLNDPVLVGRADANPADQYLAAGPDGRVFMSWTEDSPEAPGRDAFLAEIDTQGVMGSPQRMNDVPGQVQEYGGDNRTKFTVAADGGIAAVWSSTLPEYKTGEVKVTYREPGGAFQPAATLNDDGMPVNHAFAAINTSPNGKLYSTWIDGRNRNFIGMAEPVSPAEARKHIKMKDLTIPESTMRSGPMQRKEYEHDNSQLMMAVSEDNGKHWSLNYPVTGMRVCSCCVPNIAFLEGGNTVIVSYRFVQEDFLRDQVVIRSPDGGRTFSEPTYISDDGWVAEFCPHAAASMTNDHRGRIHAAWFTAGRTEEEAGIYYTYSGDAGRTFQPRFLLARTPAHTILHAEVAVDPENRVWVAWEDFVEEKPQIFLAYLDPETQTWSRHYQLSDGSMISILPMLAAQGGNVYVAWTDKRGETSRVRLRSASLVDG